MGQACTCGLTGDMKASLTEYANKFGLGVGRCSLSAETCASLFFSFKVLGLATLKKSNTGKRVSRTKLSKDTFYNDTVIVYNLFPRISSTL